MMDFFIDPPRWAILLSIGIGIAIVLWDARHPAPPPPKEDTALFKAAREVVSPQETPHE